MWPSRLSEDLSQEDGMELKNQPHLYSNGAVSIDIAEGHILQWASDGCSVGHAVHWGHIFFFFLCVCVCGGEGGILPHILACEFRRVDH